MWNTVGRWTLGIASSIMLTAPALGARADETRQIQDHASQPGRHDKARDDERITFQVQQKLNAAEPAVTDVQVQTKKDVVTLSGSVDSEATRSQAIDIARQVAGVKQVKDQMEVNPRP